MSLSSKIIQIITPLIQQNNLQLQNQTVVNQTAQQAVGTVVSSASVTGDPEPLAGKENITVSFGNNNSTVGVAGPNQIRTGDPVVVVGGRVFI